MREGGKKNRLRKKNSEPIFGKVDEGDEIKKNIGQISRKVYEGDGIKKTFDLFENKLMRTTKKTSQKKHRWKNVFFISRNKLVFFRMFFSLKKFMGFFAKSATI